MKQCGALLEYLNHYVLKSPWKFTSKTRAHDVFAGNHESGPKWFTK